MRRMGWCLLGAMLVACSSSGGTGEGASGGDGPDGGTPATALDGGAADGAGTAPDGGAGADAGAGALAVLRVVSTSGPVKDVLVYFHDATGKQIAVVKTDAAGVASRAVDAGATESATVVAANTNTNKVDAGRLVTFVGIAPGDDIVVPYPEQETYGGVDVTLAAHPDAAQYEVFAGYCNTYAPVVDVPILGIYEHCRKGKDIPLLALVRRDGEYEASIYAVKKGTTFVDKSTVVATGFPAWTPSALTHTIHPLNKPPTASATQFGIMLEIDGILVYPRRRQSAGDVEIRALPGAADALHVNALVPRVTGAGFGAYRLVARRDSTGQALVEVDMSGLPDSVSDVKLTAQLPAPAMTFNRGTAQAAEVAVLGRVAWQTCVWTVVAPPGTTAIAMPQIPVTAATCLSSAFASPGSAVAVFHADMLADYAAAKRAWYMLDGYALFGADVASFHQPLSQDGQLRLAGAHD